MPSSGVGVSVPSWPRPDFEVAGDDARPVVFGSPLGGVRVDCSPTLPPTPGALRFEFSVTAALPLQLAELDRLWRLFALGVLRTPAPGRDVARSILILRSIDALAEGASLRAIGTGLVQAGEWPGDGEWVKSRARRLVAAGRAMWAGGPAAILAPPAA